VIKTGDTTQNLNFSEIVKLANKSSIYTYIIEIFIHGDYDKDHMDDSRTFDDQKFEHL